MSLPTLRPVIESPSESSSIVSVGSDDDTSSVTSSDDISHEMPARPATEPAHAVRAPAMAARPDASRADMSQTLPSSWPRLSALRAVMEFAWHAPAKVANAGAFHFLAAAPALPMRYVAASLTGIAAGYCSYRLVVSRTGDSACGKALAVAAGLVAGGAAGMATAQGSAYPGLMTAAASVIGMFASHVSDASQRPAGTSGAAEYLGPGLVVATLGGSIAVAVALPSLRALDLGRLHRRTLAVLAEAATIELLKGPMERAMPAADPRMARFERKLKMALIGLLPYAACSILLNGLVGNLMRAQMRSERFEIQLMVSLVGALASVAKGAVNAAIVASGGLPDFCGERRATHVRPAERDLCVPAGITLGKIALRFTIAHARDVIYLALVDSGVPETAAACLAFGLYAFFAQHRDLLFDMMQGDGWSEPQLAARNDVSSA